MNFFDRQQQVRRVSGRLVLLFAVAVVGMVITVNLVVLIAFRGFERSAAQALAMIVVTSVLTVGLIGFASLFRSLSLRSGGGSRVAHALGATPVSPDTRDPQLRRLRNVVEEIAIASGTPVPELFVMGNERGINAFAAGWSTSDAAVAVTRGALEQLNRDELQGVIAHEFSHVVNGDMRLNIKLMGLLFGILVLTLTGRTLIYAGGRNRNAAPILLVALGLVLVGFIGLFVGRIIKAGVSRQREYLADASAVQFTRQTAGLTGALKKIGGLPTGSDLKSPKAEDVSHMLFGSGKGFSGLFATHPPLVERIQALDPSFNPAELEQLAQRWAAAPPSGMAEDRTMGLTGGSDPLPAAEHAVAVTPAAVAAGVGTPAEGSFGQAGSILEQLPEALLDRARDPGSVLPLVFGLLLSPTQEVRTGQHAVLAHRHGQQVADAAWTAAPELASLHPMLRLPLAEIAFPALRRRTGDEQAAVVETVHALIQADGHMDVSEYCLSRLLHTELYESAHHRPPWGRQRSSLPASRDAGGMLLAVLAAAGHDTHAEAEAAFHAGVAHLFGGPLMPYAPPPQGAVALESAWPVLDGLHPAGKQLLVEAMVVVISHDGAIQVTEMELLRTICGVLHCPLPPLALRPTPADPRQG